MVCFGVPERQNSGVGWAIPLPIYQGSKVLQLMIGHTLF